jgi:hypothetical protein
MTRLVIAWLMLVLPISATAQEPSLVPAKPLDKQKLAPLSMSIEGDVDAELAPVAGKLAALFWEGYPKLLERFDHPAKPAPRHIRIVFVKNLRVPAQCAGNRIDVSTSWLKKHPEDTALLTHEMTHAVQQYPGAKETGWLVEGIADYAREIYGPKEQKDWSLPKKLTAKQSWKDSYRTAARFLVWLEKRTPGTIDKLHRNLQNGTYKPEDFQTIAGRPLEALWEECIAELAK